MKKKQQNNLLFSPSVVECNKRLLLALAFASIVSIDGFAQVANSSSASSGKVAQSSTSTR